MLKAMTGLRIRTRIFAGFGFLVACAACVAGFGIDRLLLVRDCVTLTETLTARASRLDDLVLTLEAVRRAALRFRSDGNDAALSEVRRGFKAITAELQRSEKGSVSVPGNECRAAGQLSVERRETGLVAPAPGAEGARRGRSGGR
jgi:hypothetical protein